MSYNNKELVNSGRDRDTAQHTHQQPVRERGGRRMRGGVPKLIDFRGLDSGGDGRAKPFARGAITGTRKECLPASTSLPVGITMLVAVMARDWQPGHRGVGSML